MLATCEGIHNVCRLSIDLFLFLHLPEWVNISLHVQFLAECRAAADLVLWGPKANSVFHPLSIWECLKSNSANAVTVFHSVLSNRAIIITMHLNVLMFKRSLWMILTNDGGKKKFKIRTGFLDVSRKIWKHSSACSLELLHVFCGTVTFLVNRLYLMTCNQSDSSVGGTLSETTEKWLQI